MSRTEKVPLELAYKGERTYLHGTDMYNAIMGYLSKALPQCADGPLKMVMHDVTRNQVDLLYRTGEDRCPKPENARLEFSLAGNVSGWLSETDRPVRSSVPYPEHEIVAGSLIEGHTITAVSGATCTAIDVLVSLTKHLHASLYPAEAGWMFTRLDLQRALGRHDADNFQVELVQNLGNRLTKSVIRVGNVALGHIYFSAVRS